MGEVGLESGDGVGGESVRVGREMCNEEGEEEVEVVEGERIRIGFEGVVSVVRMSNEERKKTRRRREVRCGSRSRKRKKKRNSPSSRPCMRGDVFGLV